jgi:2-dehydro-3-deoxygalactonokinase
VGTDQFSQLNARAALTAVVRAEAPAGAAVAVGVDWGTTHRRGYAMAADGRCIAEHADGDGMLAARGRFPAALDALLAALGVEGTDVPVLMSGMVGSAQGWVEAPYLDPQVPLSHLCQHLVDVLSRGRRIRIVPGYCLRRGEHVDVMRGEETQLLGAVALGHADGWFVLPGTHSKWVHLRAGVIDDFATFMTGELFALLGSQGTLAVAAAAADVDSPGAFAAGLHAPPDAALSHALFSCRARVVSGVMPAADMRSYLSGLLIGAEWHDLRRRCGGQLPPAVTLIGVPALAARHADAAQAFGIRLHCLEPRAAYLAALSKLLA